MRSGLITLAALALLAAEPTRGQQQVTNDCTGQPAFTAAGRGDQVLNAFPGGVTYTTLFRIVTGGPCNPIPAGFVDSVTCFVPRNDCSPRVLLTGPGDDRVYVAITTGTCSTDPMCAGQIAYTLPDLPVPLTAPLAAGQTACFLGASDRSSGKPIDYTITDLEACGTLAVEPQTPNFPPHRSRTRSRLPGARDDAIHEGTLGDW